MAFLYDIKTDSLSLEIPLSGDESSLCVCFGARGMYQRGGFAPWPLFECAWDTGTSCVKLRHNETNQIKSPLGQINLDTTSFSNIGVWRDYRIILNRSGPDLFEIALFIDGVFVWCTACPSVHNDDGKTASGGFPKFSFFHPLCVGTAHAVFSYILLLRDNIPSDSDAVNSVSASASNFAGKMSVDDLCAITGTDLRIRPEVDESRFTWEAFPAVPQGETYQGDKYPFHIFPDGTKGLNPDSLPFSKNRVEKVKRRSFPSSDLSAGNGIHGEAAKVNASDFREVPSGGTADARITVKVNPASAGAKTVFCTISEALEFLQVNHAGNGIVHIASGIYTEPLAITGGNISLVGENPFTTVITGYKALVNGIARNVLVHCRDGKFSAENITFYNRGAEWNASIAHAERRGAALCTENMRRGDFYNCLFLGQQDTLYLKSGRLSFNRCYIEGDIDYICGGATARFIDCHLHSLLYSGGFITAASPVNEGSEPFGENQSCGEIESCGENESCVENESYGGNMVIDGLRGFIFYRCLLTMDGAQKVPLHLGRGPWVNGSGLADDLKNSVPSAVSFIECEMGQPDRPFLLDEAAHWCAMDKDFTGERYIERGNSLNGKPMKDFP